MATNNQNPEKEIDQTVINKITESLMYFIGNIPSTSQDLSDDPKSCARKIANTAAIKAASTAGVLALPPGPLGWATILPEIVTVWKIQGQMVADIAGAFGKKAPPSLARANALLLV